MAIRVGGLTRLQWTWIAGVASLLVLGSGVAFAVQDAFNLFCDGNNYPNTEAGLDMCENQCAAINKNCLHFTYYFRWTGAFLLVLVLFDLMMSLTSYQRPEMGYVWFKGIMFVIVLFGSLHQFYTTAAITQDLIGYLFAISMLAWLVPLLGTAHAIHLFVMQRQGRYTGSVYRYQPVETAYEAGYADAMRAQELNDIGYVGGSEPNYTTGPPRPKTESDA